MDLAVKLGRFEALAPGGWRILERVLPTFATVKSKDIQEAVRKYLDDDQLTIVWSLPEPQEQKARRRSRS